MSTEISVNLTDRLAKRLAVITRQTNDSLNAIIEKAVVSYLSDYDDCEIARKRLDDDDDPTISSAEMRSTLGL